MKSRKRYLDSIPIEEALRIWLVATGTHNPEPETLEAPASVGRVLCSAVYAKTSSPHYNSAAMDGIAVLASDTFGASEARPITLDRERFTWTDTGDPMPDGKNAVIMSEDLSWEDDGRVTIIAPASPWQHVRPVGEDIVATELLFSPGHRVRPMDLGALLAAGIWHVEVAKKPVVALIPTGDEIVEPSLRLLGDLPDLRKGEIIESNTYVQAALVESWGGHPVRFGVVADDKEALSKALRDALALADVVVLNAGSSAGSEDFTAEIVEEAGELLVHGVAQKPGKPVILGSAGGKPVCGMPGYPVSAYLTFNAFVKPMVARLLGTISEAPEEMTAALTRRVPSTAGVEEFIRVKMGRVSGKMIASPVSRGAGVITSLVRADGIVRVPRQSEGLGEGSQVRVQLLRPAGDIEDTVCVIGSHDPGLDLLSAFMKKSHGAGLSSSHAGSLGGLLALSRNEAHAAGTHLVDEDTGEYNVSYIKKALPGRIVHLVAIARRHQGFMIQKSNPLGIMGVEDLSRVRYVNRQRGAGTRILLDLMLRRNGIDPQTIEGYSREEFTHTAVAALVASGSADVGLGVLSAARALSLDFVPVTTELYELAIPDEHFSDRRVQAMIETLSSDEFKRALDEMGGYDVQITGEERLVTP